MRRKLARSILNACEFDLTRMADTHRHQKMDCRTICEELNRGIRAYTWCH